MKPGQMRACLAIAALLGLLGSQAAAAHAFPEQTEPRVGAVIDSVPNQVRIWFDADLEPAFSTLRVLDAQGRQVNRDPGQVSAEHARLLEHGCRRWRQASTMSSGA
jgi:methionine-rich copper-binding protein CopC